jgi:hypothetical protein
LTSFKGHFVNHNGQELGIHGNIGERHSN